MTIYDCFTFFDELDVLDIRLHELAPVVDKFVLVESTKTFRNASKRLYYKENKHKFTEFVDRIIHVIVEDTPLTPNPWEVEYFQRNAIVRGLVQCQPNDIILLSDVDEIPRATTVALNDWHSALNNQDCYWFNQIVSYYYLNCVANISWNGTRVVRYEMLGSPQAWRDKAGLGLNMAGWHMSYLGTPERISRKIAAFAHSEYDTPEFNNVEHLAECLEKGRDLFNRADIEFQIKPVTECDLPQYVLQNLGKFKHLVKG